MKNATQLNSTSIYGRRCKHLNVRIYLTQLHTRPSHLRNEERHILESRGQTDRHREILGLCNRVRYTNEEDDGVDDGENFEDVVGGARLAWRHRLAVDSRRAVIFVACHRQPRPAYHDDRTTTTNQQTPRAISLLFSPFCLQRLSQHATRLWLPVAAACLRSRRGGLASRALPRPGPATFSSCSCNVS